MVVPVVFGLWLAWLPLGPHAEREGFGLLERQGVKAHAPAAGSGCAQPCQQHVTLPFPRGPAHYPFAA